jgi:putative aldouronate transport system substrate-binding protein
MIRSKKTAQNLIAAITAVAVLTGCAGTGAAGDQSADKNTSTPASGNAPEDTVTFDWYINYSWFNTKWGDNAVSKAITEKTGVDINFVTPQGNEEEKLNSIIAAGTLPDLITLGWWEPQVNEIIQGDMVYALNELADQYDPYFFEVADPQALSWYTQADGNVYGYPCSSVTPDDVENNDNIGSNQTFLVRKDIYEAIGSPDMTTIEGFESAVKRLQ